MENIDLQLLKSVTVNDLTTNGGRASYNQVTSSVLNNMFQNISQSERVAGVTKYRKFFVKNKNASNEIGVNSRIWISSKSTGNNYYRLKAGTNIDTQAEADDYADWAGTGYLSSPASTDETSAEILFDAASGIFNGSVVRMSDSSGGEEFLTVALSDGVSWNGNTATVTFTSGIRSTYPSGQNSIVSTVIDLGNIVASTSDWAETSTAGTYDEASYPVEVNNIGTITDTWTLMFTSANTFIVSGANTGSIGTGSIASNFTPVNASAGGGAYYLLIRSAGWGGTWQSGDTVTFSTLQSSAAFWAKEVTPAGTSSKASNTVIFKIYTEGA